jgi:hypothetical protein
MATGPFPLLGPTGPLLAPPAAGVALARFDAASARTSLIVGVLPALLGEPSSSPSLAAVPDASWRALFRHPYGLTDASVVLTQAAASVLCSGLAPSPSAPSPPSPWPSSSLRLQHSKGAGVLLLDVDAPAATSTPPTPTAFVPVKRTVGRLRFLLLLGEGALSFPSTTTTGGAPATDAALASSSAVAVLPDGDGEPTLAEAAPFLLCGGVAQYRRGGPGGGSAGNESPPPRPWPAHLVALTPALLARLHGLCDWLKRRLHDHRAGGDSMWRLVETASKDALDVEAEGASLSSSASASASSAASPASSPPPTFLVSPAVVAGMVMAAGPAVPAPTSAPSAGVKRPRPADDVGEGEGVGGPTASSAARPRVQQPLPPSSSSPSSPPGIRLAVIVPFRDQPEQNRGEQLRRFAAHLPAFLRSAAVTPPLAGFHVIVVEQAQDGHKFNRGKALNAGFAIATHPDRVARYGLPPGPPFTAFAFHDVDLLPGPALGPWYARPAHPRPLHIGAVWTRYPYPTYVGGILTMSEKDVRATNG